MLDELRAVGPSTIRPVIQAIDRTQDEGLRFQLWEAACAMTKHAVADAAAARLREPGKHYGLQLGAEALAASAALPEPVISGGLGLAESDLKRNAVDRHGPAGDVTQHRRQLDKERERARSYQALVLLSVASRRSPAGKALMRSWAEAADPELATAAWAGLAMYGDPEAHDQLRKRAAERGAVPLVDRLLAEVTPRAARGRPRRIRSAQSARCSTCGRTTTEVAHLMAGSKAVMCDRCVVRVGQSRKDLPAPEDATCDLCGATQFEVRGVYAYNGKNICSRCLQQSLGLLEREAVDRFLANW